MIPGRVALVAACVAFVQGLTVPGAVAGDAIGTIERVKGSIVAVGTYERTRAPPFQFRGTGFVVGDGTLIATNAHVVASQVDPARREVLGILVPGAQPGDAQFREARQLAVDPDSDLALLAIGGAPMPAMRIGDSDGVRAGQEILFTGFPIGAVLGPYPATHRGMVAAITPLAIPQGQARSLDPKLIRRLTAGSYPVFQLDATAYPGNSGSPVYDVATGEVLGIVNMVFVKGTKETALTQPSGITYAIPAKHLQELMRKSR